MSLHESVLIGALVDLLNDLLPASGAPTTFGSPAAAAGLSETWKASQGLTKKLRIRNLVLGTGRRTRQCASPLVEKVVAESLGYRRAKNNPLTQAEVLQIARLTEELRQPVHR